MLEPAPTLPSAVRELFPDPAIPMKGGMKTTALQIVPQAETCPYCGQPVTHRQLEEIRERVRREEQERLKALEKQLRAQSAADMKAQAQQLAKRRAELARQEQMLRQKMKSIEAAAKARFDEGYRKAKGEAQRAQLQLQKQIEDLKRRVERKTADELGAVSEEELLALLQRCLLYTSPSPRDS